MSLMDTTMGGGTDFQVGGSFMTDLQNLFFDVARFKLIDQEMISDTNNLPDRVDVREGDSNPAVDGSSGLYSRQILGIPLWGWAAAVVAGAILLKLK